MADPSFSKNPVKQTYLLFLLSAVTFSCRNTGNVTDNSVIVNDLLSKATLLVDQHKEKEAFNLIDAGFSKIKRPGIGDRWRKYRFKYKTAFQTARLNNDPVELKIANNYADSMLNVMNTEDIRQKYPEEYSKTLFSKGDLLLEAGNYDEAYRAFYKGKVFAEKHGDNCSRAFFDSRFALLNYRQQKYRKAATLFMQTFNDQQACTLDFDSFAAAQGAMDNAGLSYHHLGLTDSALICYKATISYADKNAARFPEKARFIKDIHGLNYGYIAQIYLERGDLKAGEALIKKNIEFNGHGGNEGKTTQIMQLKLARAYLEAGHLNDAGKMAAAIRSSLDTLPNPRAEMEWQQLKWKYYSALKLEQKAKPYLVTYLKLKDSADAKTRKFDTADADNGFQRIQNEYELDTLKKKNELSSLYLLAALGFTILPVLIIFLIFRSWRLSKRNNATLTKTLTSLEQSQQENTRMMQIVAHDLRSPIGAIATIASMMLEQQRPEDDRMMLDMIKTSGQNSLTLVSDLLQVHTRTEELKKEPVDLHSMLHYCVELLHHKADAKAQKVVLQAPHIDVPVNREKFWRVISNLIGNAIKFSPTGAVITIKLQEMPQHVLISVEDHGIGIPDEMKDNIFDMFTQAKRSGTAGEQAFGLGLAISKQIIEAHGGRIWFESPPGNGTTFYVELPA
ncbi:ATP-binding protein [Mucilaginibacter angelicae]|uniref:histidine kinase n=1 Tax=Mucilaginibacter angelicae TaxID=869718 RepID=A0ABV6L8Q4_9SPHI